MTVRDQGAAYAHMDIPVTPDNVWRSWNLDPLIIVPMLVLVALYVRGVQRVWLHAGRGRGITHGQAAAFAGGIFILVVALISPVDQLGGALFSVHMVQHLLLVVVAAPLLVYAAPLTPVLVALPRTWRRAISSAAGQPVGKPVRRALTNPLVVWSAQTVVLWMWHIPRLYEAALASSWVHSLEHLTFFSTAMLFWWLVIQPHGRRVLGLGMAVIFIFTAMVQSSALGALITFAPSHWYDAHAPYVAAWGLTSLSDQQLAGLIMWMPAGLVYLIAALIVFAAWFRSMDAVDDTGPSSSRMLDSMAGTDRSHSPRSG
jgi:putative membrane protein